METVTGTGGQILVKTLARHGVNRIACVAGESYLPVLDALLDQPKIAVVTCRHESGAGFMAESLGKLTGQTGICFVTRGPGACNAAIAVHTARQDSTPLIVFVGQVRRGERGREAFQEIDIRAVFGSMAKWATEIDDAARIPEVVGRAFHVAQSGRPGPVVIGLPEDMLSEESTVVLREPIELLPSTPSRNHIDSIFDLLGAAKKPLLIAGGSGWSEKGIAALANFIGAAHLPAAVAFRNHDLIDHRHDGYAGELGTAPNPALIERVKAADLLLVIGSRLDEITTQGYSVIEQQKLIHIHQDNDELGKVYAPVLGLQADLNKAAAALADAANAMKGCAWIRWTKESRRDYQDWTRIDPAARPAFNGADMTLIFDHLRKTLPADAIITTDAGNFSGWAQRYLHYGRPGRLLAPVSGAMGYAVPSAIGASLACPRHLVLGLCGDGGFMMTGAEIATAMHHGAAPVIIVCNNNMYGTIRMHQEKRYPGRVSATALTNPDFIALAESYGAFTARVERADDFPAIWNAARAAGRIALIEVVMDPRQITTRSL